jgi:hypothetical protein
MPCIQHCHSVTKTGLYSIMKIVNNAYSHDQCSNYRKDFPPTVQWHSHAGLAEFNPARDIFSNLYTVLYCLFFRLDYLSFTRVVCALGPTLS